MKRPARDEFSLIAEYFGGIGTAPGVAIGVGDDAAVLDPPVGSQLVLCTDTLVAGRHFLTDANASDVGWKALAVNLSDLAAMGADAHSFLLALTLPDDDDAWLRGFSEGLRDCADRYGVQLIGGDTTRGPLTITVTAQGWAPAAQAISRRGAQAGEGIYLAGAVGLAAAGLDCLTGQCPPPPNQSGTAADAVTAARNAARNAARKVAVAAHARPVPQLAAGVAARGHASAMIDISDGLLQDLGHVLRASPGEGLAGEPAGELGAQLDLAALARTAPALEVLSADAAQRRQWQLAGGDDYALLATAPQALSGWQRIGTVVERSGITDIETGETLDAAGFQHF